MKAATVVPALILVLGCATPRSGLDLTGMDRAIAPGDDFYDFASGAWQARAVIPPERSRAGPILTVQELVAARVRAIDEEATRSSAPPGSEFQQIGHFYASFMDEDGIEAKGLAPLRPALDRIAAIGDRRALAAELGGSIRADVDALNATDLATGNVLGLWVEQDLNVPARNAAYLLQGGLGLPDRSYYLDDGGGFPDLRIRYRAHLAAMFRLSGVPAAEAEARAGRVLDHETRIARTHATRAETFDVAKANNPWGRSDFDARAPGMDWGAFLGAAGLDRQQSLIVWHPAALAGLAALARSEPLDTWKEYLAARALEQAAPFLPRAFAEEHFRFHGTELKGTTLMLPRWQRAVAETDLALGEAVGRIYVERHFTPEARRELRAWWTGSSPPSTGASRRSSGWPRPRRPRPGPS